MDTFKNFPLEYHQFNIQGHPFKIAMVHNAWHLLDRITEEEFKKDEKMPYWAEIWPGSIVLSKWFLSQNIPKASHILEIGAGVGMTSVVLSHFGYSVVASDYDPDALEFCKLNARINKVQNPPQTLLLDWRKPASGQKFDYITGSDIIYEVRNILPIVDVLHENLKPGGKCWLTDPGRRPIQHLKTIARENDIQMTAVHEEFIQFRHSNQTVTVYELEVCP